jgi:hypothetical protein
MHIDPPADASEWDDPQPRERHEETVGHVNVTPEQERELIEVKT